MRYKILTKFTKCADYRSWTGADRLAAIVPGRYHGYEYARLYSRRDDAAMAPPALPQIKVLRDERIDQLLAGAGGKICLLFPGGASNPLNTDEVRRWRTENYAETARQLIVQGYTVLLCGLQSDEYVLPAFEGIAIVNALGKTDLQGLLYLLSKSDLLITHDTGALHLAKLTGTKCIGLFGPVHPRERIGVDERIVPLWMADSLPCAPCYDGKRFAPCTDNQCMKSISVESVIQAING
jgi:heptosyltransferase-2